MAERRVQPPGLLDCGEARRVTLKGLCYLEMTSESIQTTERFTGGKGQSYLQCDSSSCCSAGGFLSDRTVFLVFDAGAVTPRRPFLNWGDEGGDSEAALTAALNYP